MPASAGVGEDPAPLARELRFLADVGRARSCARAAGVTSRDPTPPNIIVS